MVPWSLRQLSCAVLWTFWTFRNKEKQKLLEPCSVSGDRIPMHGTFNNLKNWYYKVIWKLAWFWLIVCLVIFCETWPNKTFNDPVLKFCCLFVNFDEIFSRIHRSLQLVQEVGQYLGHIMKKDYIKLLELEYAAFTSKSKVSVSIDQKNL